VVCSQWRDIHSYSQCSSIILYYADAPVAGIARIAFADGALKQHTGHAGGAGRRWAWQRWPESVLPVLCLQILQVSDDFVGVQRVAVGVPVDWLNLQERKRRVEFDRHVGAGETEYGEERAKPSIRLDDSFIKLVAFTAWEICRRPNKQRPSWRGAGKGPAPHLQPSRPARSSAAATSL